MENEICIMQNRICALELALRTIVSVIGQPVYGPMIEEREDDVQT